MDEWKSSSMFNETLVSVRPNWSILVTASIEPWATGLSPSPLLLRISSCRCHIFFYSTILWLFCLYWVIYCEINQLITSRLLLCISVGRSWQVIFSSWETWCLVRAHCHRKLLRWKSTWRSLYIAYFLHNSFRWTCMEKSFKFIDCKRKKFSFNVVTSQCLNCTITICQDLLTFLIYF